MLAGGQLIHDALFYAGDEGFVAGVAPILRDGIARGHACVVAATRHNNDLLRDDLGGAADTVAFIDRDDWYRRPARTVFGWKRLVDEAVGDGHPYVRIIGEVRFGDGDEHATWARYESALNLIFDAAPCWITCPYDVRTLAPTVVADAQRTHPTVVYAPDARELSGAYQSPEQFLTALPEPHPLVHGQPAVHILADRSLAEVRRVARRAVTEGGWLDGNQLEDFILALSEIVANSMRYGRGERAVYLWPTSTSLVCEVTDEGDGPTDPLAGYRPPEDSAQVGRGMWIAQQLTDAMSVDTSGGRTRVRFAIHREV
jgi:anti-sigma regulatory factor (Ser/Thr protein kinase)